jgi:hypothetical protein
MWSELERLAARERRPLAKRLFDPWELIDCELELLPPVVSQPRPILAEGLNVLRSGGDIPRQIKGVRGFA